MAKGAIIGGILSSVFENAMADGKQEFFLTPEQQAKVATRLNAVINLPLVGEIVEQAIFLKVVQSFDRNTYKFIPKEILAIAAKGGEPVPAEIVAALKENLPTILMQALPLPFLQGPVKQALVSVFVNLLTQALAAGQKIGG